MSKGDEHTNESVEGSPDGKVLEELAFVHHGEDGMYVRKVQVHELFLLLSRWQESIGGRIQLELDRSLP